MKVFRTRKSVPLLVAFVAVVISQVAATRAGLEGKPLEDRSSEPYDVHGKQQERFLYVATIAQSATDPDFIAEIGADPRFHDFGKIVNRVDMPNVGDELHHFGYSADQHRLIVPGLFSN